jgi:hypothetical protein
MAMMETASSVPRIHFPKRKWPAAGDEPSGDEGQINESLF